MTLHTSRAERVPLDLGAPRLYREELEEISRLLWEECEHDLHIDFHDDLGRTGTEVADFARYAAADGTSETLGRLTLRGSRGGTTMTLSFTGSKSELVVENPDNSARGAAGQIQAICRANPHPGPRRTRNSADASRMLFALLGSLGFAVSFLGAVMVLSNPEAIAFPTVFLLLCSVGIGLGSLMLWSAMATARPLLINLPRSERPTWWERHRRDVANLAIGWVLGGVTSYLVNQIPGL